MSKEQHADSTPDEKAPHSTTLSADGVLVEAARNGDTTAVRAGLEKLSPDTDSKTVSFDAVHEACRGNHDECLALLLPYVETTQMGFGMLLSECVHADHTARTEVLLQHWKSVCSNVAFVPYGQEEEEDQPCPAMWEDPAVCQVLIDAGADIETKDDMGRSPLRLSSGFGNLTVVKMLVKAGAGVCVTDNEGDTCLILAACCGHTETVSYLVGLKDVAMNHSGDDGFTALHWAGQENYPEVVQVLIDAGADIEVKDGVGRSPLLVSSCSGSLDVVKVLVKAGADVCVADNEGDTCLTLAAWFGQIETVRYLVGLPEVDMNQRGLRGRTALHMAVLKVHADVVEVLIDAGADIEVKAEKGRSPLHCASSSGSLAIVKMLVKAGAGVRATDNKGDTCLTLVSTEGHTETVRYLVDLPEVDLHHKNDLGSTALVCTRNPHALQVLIDAGADIEAKNNFGRSALQCASVHGDLVIVKMLVKAGAGVCVRDNVGDTCLILAAYKGHTETVRYLATLPEVDMNQRGRRGQTALHRVALTVHADVVGLLIDAGADIEVKDGVGRSPLLVSSCSGNLDVVKVLVKAGADVCVADNEGDTCLILAAWFGQIETVRYLVGLPEVDMNQRSLRGRTALHMAVLKVHADVAEVIIDAGADIEVKDEKGRSPLHCASRSGSLAIVKMLVKAGAGVRATDNKGDTCLTLVSTEGHTETVRYLVDLPVVDLHHKNDLGSTALVCTRNPHALQVLIDAGADIEAKNNFGRSALQCASVHGDLVIVKMLVKAGAGVCVRDKVGDTCLILAAYKGHTETVRYLATLPEVDMNQRGRRGQTALHRVALTVHADVVGLLIDAGADIEAKDDHEWSPLHMACEAGKIANVKMLVKAGAEVFVTNDDGDTCLILATYHGHTDSVRYIVGLREVDLNHKGFNDLTALQNAVDKEHPDVVQLLIDAGADIETKDEEGQSPLHWASRSGSLAIVKMLVEAGAGVCVTDNEGRTCLTLAGANGHTEIVRYLANLPEDCREVDVKQTDRLGNTTLEAALEQGNAMKEEMKALQEMMKSVMDQQKEMLEAQKGVLGPTEQTAPVSEQPEQGGMAELRAECAEMRETVRQCSEHIVKLAEESKRLAEENESLKKAARDAKMKAKDCESTEVDESGNGRRSEGSYYSRLRALPHSK